MTETPDETGRYWDDDGNELDPNQFPKPALCCSCAKDNNGDPEEVILCNLTRMDLTDESDFQCFDYEPKKGN